MQLYAWACSVLREHVSKGTYGSITIAMANGKISNIKQELNMKPPIDGKQKQ